MTDVDPTARLRRSVYTLLSVAVVAAAAARVLAVERVYEPSLHRPESGGNPTAPLWPKARPTPMPMFSSNDRSRWATIRSLVDEGTFVIGKRDYDDAGRYRDSGIIFEDGWQSVDKVLHPETKQFYSSKPPLLSVLLAGEYWALQKVTGWTLQNEPWKVVCTILLTVNVIPLGIYLILLSRLLERFGTTDWGRLFTFAAAGFGTFLTTFATTLNNHTPAAVTTLAAVYPILMDDRLSLRSLLLSGIFAGLTACFELPAAAFVAALAVGVVVLAPRRALLVFVPVVMLPVAAQLSLNYAAVGDWKPVYEKLDSPWYRYEGSHWNKVGAERRGIDYAGEFEDRRTYAFHLLLGHHGVFSLTPVWLLTAIGLVFTLTRPGHWERSWALVLLITFAVSVVVLVYFAEVVGTVNYGGWTSGPRWFFWLTPLWLLALLPAADWLAPARWGRALGYLLLGVSVFSASFPAWNPWRHPWIYQYLEAAGWVRYW